MMAGHVKADNALNLPWDGAREQEPAEELNGRIWALLISKKLSEEDAEILRIIWPHKGAASPVRLAEIMDAMHWRDTQNNRRKVKGAVEWLIVGHRVPIGARRHAPAGYFLIVTPRDLAIALHPLRSEWYALLRRIYILEGKRALAKLFGQKLLEFEGQRGLRPEDRGPERAA
jgi:hypothetical protein